MFRGLTFLGHSVETFLANDNMSLSFLSRFLFYLLQMPFNIFFTGFTSLYCI